MKGIKILKKYKIETSNKNNMMLIKFVEKKYVEDFLNGEIHFTRLGYFIDLEKNHGDSIVGDINEGKALFSINPQKVHFYLVNDDGTLKEDLGNVNMSSKHSKMRGYAIYPEVKSSGISCFSYLSLENDFDLIKVDGNIRSYSINKDIIEELRKIGEGRIPIIMFQNPIYSAIKKNPSVLGNFDFSMNLVEYYKGESNNISLKELKEDHFKPIFTKRDKYSNQRELRMVLKGDVKEGYNLNIGKLENAIPLKDLEMLSNLVLFLELKRL